MTLAEYLRREKISDAEFGGLCKPPLHRSEVWFYKHRRRSPRAETVAEIERVTRRLVTAKDLTVR